MIKVQVNDSDYGAGRVVIEARNGDCEEFAWSVPAWEERGLAELAGDFPSREAAQAVLASVAHYLPEYGYTL